MDYTKTDIEIFKRVIRDYKIIKKDIDERIKKGYTIELLLDYIHHLSGCNITNVEFLDDFQYIDFNYCDMCISILQHGDTPYLGDTIEVWNDKENYFIGTYNNVKEIEDIIEMWDL